MPFTHTNFKEDLENVGSNFDGPPDLEFRMATNALELEQSGLSYQRVPPGYRFPYGHTHKTQEEVHVVVRGSGRMKIDDEIIELKEWDAVARPAAPRYESGEATRPRESAAKRLEDHRDQGRARREDPRVLGDGVETSWGRCERARAAQLYYEIETETEERALEIAGRILDDHVTAVELRAIHDSAPRKPWR